MNEQSVLWLYGSYARGDLDGSSDLDVLFISPHSDPIAPESEELFSILSAEGVLREAHERILSFVSEKATVSCYQWEEILEMSKYGSLFLQHLKLEGRSLWEGRSVQGKLLQILSNLPDYKRSARDLIAFRMTVNDVRDSVLSKGSIPFEMTILATVLRHSSILGSYLAGKPDFGRISPITQMIKRFSVSGEASASLMKLCRYKSFVEGRDSTTIQITEAESLKLCDQVDDLVSAIQEKFANEGT